jgi:hypothetical protein
MNEQLGEDLYTKLVDAGISQAGLKALIEQAVDAAGLGDLPNSSKPARRGSTRK